MVRIRAEAAPEMKKGNTIILFLERKNKTIWVFPRYRKSIAFLGKKQKNFKSIDFKLLTYME